MPYVWSAISGPSLSSVCGAPSLAVRRGVALGERRDLLRGRSDVVGAATGLAGRETHEERRQRRRGTSDVVRNVLGQVEHEVTVDDSLIEAECLAHRRGELVEDVHVSSLARCRSSGVSQSSHGTAAPVSSVSRAEGRSPNASRNDDRDQSAPCNTAVGQALHSHCEKPWPSTGTAAASGWHAATSRSTKAVVSSGRSPASRTTTPAVTNGRPAATAAAGPECGGSSRVHVTTRDVARSAPTTTTPATGDSAPSTRSSNDVSSTNSRVLSPPPIRRDRPPASTR